MNIAHMFSINQSKDRVIVSRPALAGALASVMMLTACGSVQPHPELAALQARYEIMSGEAYASQEASDELAMVRNALTLGREAYRDGDEDALDHYVFVADKNLDIAEVRIDLFEANSAIASASEDRESLLREIRELQLARAELEVSTAQELAESRGEALTAQQRQLRQQELELEQTENELAITRNQFEATRDRANILATELAEVSTRESERGTILVLSDIVFDLDSANLNSGSERAIDEVAEFLIEQNAGELKIEGHTDALGTDEYNEELSRDRADAVRDALVARGVDPASVEITGYGEDYPVASNDTEAGRQLNRRVEIVLNDRTGRPDISRFQPGR